MPLILLTSPGRQGAREDFGEVAGFIAKPIKPSALFDTLVSILAGQPMRVQARRRAAGSMFDPHMGQKHPLRILLAEDNATNQNLALRLLARLAYRADVAGNGREVLQALERQPYDVVLMDVQMPEMDGLEATRHIREWLPQARQPYVIAMTANAMQGDRDMCLAVGMDDYVSKPIRVEELVGALHRSHPLPAAQRAGPSDDDRPAGISQGQTDTAGLARPESEGVGKRVEAGETVLDAEALQNLLTTLGGQFEYLVELVNTFLEDAPRLLAELRRCVEQGDAAGVRRIAHSLKSNGRDLGAGTFAQACKELETLAKSGTLLGAGGMYRIEAEYAGVEAALRRMLSAREIA
jgi:CheY-like chemotaxis protein